MLKYSAQAARWGLLMTTLALGATLVGTGLMSYVSARATATAVTQALVSDTVGAVRTAIIDAGGFSAGVLERILGQLHAQGVRLITVVTPDGARASAGVESASPDAPPVALIGPRMFPGFATPKFEEVARGILRVVAPLTVAPGPSDRSDRMSGLQERPEQIGSDRTTLLIEFEPVLAESIRWRALLTLGVELVATAVLLIMASMFWRSSRRAEVAALEAEHDRQLRALGQMSAVLGHELRNPLASLKGHAQLLLEKLPEGQPGRRGAQTIVREAIRIEELSLQILEFVRTGTVTTRTENPTEVAEAAIAASRVSGVTLVAAAPPAAWPLDSGRIEQVLINLLKNARDASPEGAAIELAIALDGEHLCYEVRDCGEGLSPGDEERAFEPFVTRRAKGTGLGLALSRRIVEGHGGTITARNRADGGAVFRIELPKRARAGAQGTLGG